MTETTEAVVTPKKRYGPDNPSEACQSLAKYIREVKGFDISDAQVAATFSFHPEWQSSPERTAERERVKAETLAAREAAKEAGAAEREAKKAARETERAEKRAAREAAAEGKKAEMEAKKVEREAKRAEREAERAEKEAERELKRAEREAKRAEREEAAQGATGDDSDSAGAESRSTARLKRRGEPVAVGQSEASF